ncbi:MAG: TatD family hydrolase [Muribaculaceae bacterium]|nr:TatD family hydrolase [Muribaculaceae bacterium]
MIDTHTHIYFPEFEEEYDALIERCKKSGVSHFILPNVDEESLPSLKVMHARFPGNTSMAVGLHPTEVKDNWTLVVDSMESEAQTGNYVAIGEVGIDLYWDKSTLDFQKQAFERQLRIAEKLSLPVIIHSRNAIEETMDMIEKVKPSVPLIFHSFTGNALDVGRIRKDCDPYFGINGVVTYKNAQELRDSLKKIGIDKILLETDSPYLTPIPYRGKRNESSYLPHIRDKIAECIDLTPVEVEEITDINAKRIFKIVNDPSLHT